MKTNYIGCWLVKWILLITMGWTLSACASIGAGYHGIAPEGKIATTVSSISHYGKGIGVAEFYINGTWEGNQYNEWGGGGGFVCCVVLPTNLDKPLMVTVKWKTYRTSLNEQRWHEAVVPVNFVDNEPGYLYVHFFPGHRVEVWSSSRYGPGNPKYTGPAYPSGPAPDYVPLPDESPEPKKGNSK